MWFNKKYVILFLCVWLCFIDISCDNFLEVDPPNNELNANVVFDNDQTATAAVSALYSRLNNSSFSNGGMGSFSHILGLAADEIYPSIPASPFIQSVYRNLISKTVSDIQGIWADQYYLIYISNNIIEKLNVDNGKVSNRNQILGEALFVRAFCYFYLVNVFGDVPYVTSTTFANNVRLSRTNSSLIYQGIIGDLVSAAQLLSEEYPSGEKVRVNSYCAHALLARVYLYQQNWQGARDESLMVINSSTYRLTSLDSVFLANSDEAIWQLKPSINAVSNNSMDAALFIPSSDMTMPSFSVTENLLDRFDPDDERQRHWLNFVSGNEASRYPYKYKVVLSVDASVEYSSILRLAEQYLICAESMLNLKDIDGAVDKINSLRFRAGVERIGEDLSFSDCLRVIVDERQRELFTEWGHRWLDLKRLNFVDSVMENTKNTWVTTSSLFPIPESEIMNNINITQNSGY